MPVVISAPAAPPGGFSIGRAGLTILMGPPEVWHQQGSTISVEGRTIVSTTEALQLRDQLLGYNDNWDEQIVPVIFTAEPRLTGYYRVHSVSAPTTNALMASGYVEYAVELEPVQAYAQPWLESVLNGALLTNVLGAVAADVNWFHAIPAVALEYSNSGNPGNSPNRSSADGNLTFFWDANTTNISNIARFTLSPANYYVGAATIEQGSILRPVVGRMSFQNDVVNWRLSNGMVRVTPNGTDINVSHWDGTQWDAGKGFQFRVAGVAASTMNSVVVLRNSSEECTLRVSMSGGFATFGVTGTFDLSLRRGDRLVRLFVNSSTAEAWQLRCSTNEAATAIGAPFAAGGIRATADDASGNRYVMLSAQQAVTEDLVNGRLTLNVASTTADFGIGSVVNGGAGTAPNDPISLGRQYIAAQSESQRIVAR